MFCFISNVFRILFWDETDSNALFPACELKNKGCDPREIPFHVLTVMSILAFTFAGLGKPTFDTVWQPMELYKIHHVQNFTLQAFGKIWGLREELNPGSGNEIGNRNKAVRNPLFGFYCTYSKPAKLIFVNLTLAFGRKNAGMLTRCTWY